MTTPTTNPARVKSNSLVFLLIAFVAIALVAFLLWQARPREQHITLPMVEPAGDLSRVTGQLFDTRQSQLVVTARLPFKNLSDAAEAAVPRAINTSYGVPDTHGLSGIRVAPNLTRDALGLTPIVPSTPPKIQLNTRIHGSVAVEAFKWIIVNLLVGTVKTKSPTLHETIHVDAIVHGWVSPGIDPHWKFTRQQDISVQVNQAEFKLFDVITISVKDKLQEMINNLAPGLINNALDSAANSILLRAEVEKVWTELSKPVKVASSPDAYVLLTPDRFRIQRLTFDDPQFLTVRAAIDGKVQTRVSGQAPAPAATPLPDLTIEPTIDPKFHLLLPVGLDLGEVNKAITGRLPESPVDAGEGITVLIRSLAFYSKGSTLYVKADIQANNPKIRLKADGTLFLKCSVVYDQPSGELRLRDVDFSVETKNMLAQTAAWLLKDMICRKIQDNAKLNVNQELEKAKNLANERYGSISPAPGVKLQSHLDHVTFEKVALHDNAVVVGFDAAGEISCDIKLGGH